VNPYEILGVSREASTQDIKRAYRKLARETHPDLNPGDAVAEARFKSISVANDMLTDPKKRADYDEFGEISMEAGFDADRARAERDHFSSRFGSPGRADSGEEFAFGGLEDLFRQFQGQSGPSAMRMRGADLESSMTLDFMEAVKGNERRLSVARPGADGQTTTESVTVRFPPGITDGGRLRIPGKGGLGLGGGPPGDLWINVRVEPHPLFRRAGRNLEFDLPITLVEAVRGAKVEIPTLDGEATLTIPPGTNSHTRLRLRGKGVPAGKSGQPGDLLVRIQIQVPKEVSDDALEVLEGCSQDDPRKDLFR